MTGDSAAATNENHEPDPKRSISRLDASALIQGLERLRACFEQRLSRIEALARDRPQPSVLDRTELEQELERRIAECEQSQLRLRAQNDRHEQEWRTTLEQLEGDRTLLADAWERLERERLEGATGPAPQPIHRSPLAERTSPKQVRPEPAETDDQVAHAILKQFQALRNDVRRNAKRRGPI
jgi:hypothetical protein